MGRYYIKILLGSSLLLVSKLSLAQTANYIKTSTYLDASGISRAISADYCNGIGKKIASVSSTTDYIGSYILKNGSLDKLLFDGGYCTFSGNTPQFHYYSLDHLGNVRVVANESGALEQASTIIPLVAFSVMPTMKRLLTRRWRDGWETQDRPAAPASVFLCRKEFMTNSQRI